MSALIVADSVPDAGSVPVRLELARLSSWPDGIADDDLVTYFTLTSDDLSWLVANLRIENRRGVRRIASVDAVPVRIAVAYLIIWSYCSAMMSHWIGRVSAGAKRG